MTRFQHKKFVEGLDTLCVESQQFAIISTGVGIGLGYPTEASLYSTE